MKTYFYTIASRSLLPESRDELPALWGVPGKNSGEVAKALERGDTVAFIVNNNLLVRVKLLLCTSKKKILSSTGWGLWSETWVGLTLIWIFHQPPSRYCHASNCQSRTGCGQTLE